MMIVKQHRVAIGVVAIVLVVVIALMIVEIILNGTGFAGKTLWDWLQLLAALAIPVVVGFGAVWFTTRQGKVADAANTDNQREAALQAYLDKMSELLLHEHLRGSKPEDDIRQIAQARTLTVLSRLDGGRKRSVLQFLYEAHLINIFDWSSANLSEAALKEANLSGVNLNGANLSGANLDGADLRDTQLSQAFLIEANLRGADLSRVRCSGAKFSGADLTCADLADADLSGANLRKAKLSGANLSGANLDGADLSDAKLSKTMRWRALSTIQRRRIIQIFEGDHVRERVLHTWYSWSLLGPLLGVATLRMAFKNGTNLSSANLNRAHLSFADLSDANLERANLKETDLVKADLTRANLKEANLTEATMSKAKRFIVAFHLGKKYFPRGFWSIDDLAWADLEKVSPFSLVFVVKLLSTTEAKNLFTKAKNRLEKSDRNKILLPVVLLKPARLIVVALKVEAADLTGADLTGADLSGTNLRKAIITHEQLGKAKLLEGTTMPDGSKHQ